MGKTLVSWKELQIGDFYLDIGCYGVIKHDYCIKVDDNMFFNLETDHLYTHMKKRVEIPQYYKCDYEVW